jgi:hypothetical protein
LRFNSPFLQNFTIGFSAHALATELSTGAALTWGTR